MLCHTVLRITQKYFFAYQQNEIEPQVSIALNPRVFQYRTLNRTEIQKSHSAHPYWIIISPKFECTLCNGVWVHFVPNLYTSFYSRVFVWNANVKFHNNFSLASLSYPFCQAVVDLHVLLLISYPNPKTWCWVSLVRTFNVIITA